MGKRRGSETKDSQWQYWELYQLQFEHFPHSLERTKPPDWEFCPIPYGYIPHLPIGMVYKHINRLNVINTYNIFSIFNKFNTFTIIGSTYSYWIVVTVSNMWFFAVYVNHKPYSGKHVYQKNSLVESFVRFLY